MTTTVQGVGVAITVDESSWMTTVSLEGQLNSSNIGALVTALDLACAALPHRVVVDCSRLKSGGTHALGVLLSASERMKTFGEVHVRHPTRSLRRAFERTGSASLLSVERSRRPATR